MFWIVMIVIFAIIAACLDSVLGKIVFGAVVLAIGALFLYWITDTDFLITLAKWCGITIVVTLTGALLIGIIGK